MTKSKKTSKVVFTVSGKRPEGNKLKASIAATPTSHITGQKVSFTHRYSLNIDTGTNVKIPEGYVLCFSVSSDLANKGMVATNAPGRVTSGNIFIHLLNCGREIVEIKDGDHIADFWLEEVIDSDFVDENQSE